MTAADNREKIWRIIGNQEANVRTLTQLFDKHCVDDATRHSENLERLDTIAEKQRSNAQASAAATAAANAAAHEAAAAARELTARLEQIMPVMRRMRAREVFRRKLRQCVSRWRRQLVAAGISAAALFVWLDGHWPKIAALLRKALGGG